MKSYIMQKKAMGQPRRSSLKFMLQGTEEAISIIRRLKQQPPGDGTNG
jgi:hypothetical protein